MVKQISLTSFPFLPILAANPSNLRLQTSGDLRCHFRPTRLRKVQYAISNPLVCAINRPTRLRNISTKYVYFQKKYYITSPQSGVLYNMAFKFLYCRFEDAPENVFSEQIWLIQAILDSVDFDTF